MPLPSQTYSTIQQLINDINTRFIPNGVQEITGDAGNSMLNGLATFIQTYTMNNGLAGISSSTGVISLSKPITIFSVVPTSFSWPPNVQNEYYIVNATGSAIPITAGSSFTDQYGTVQTSIAANDAVHIAKATNGSWFRINNVSGTGSGGLPPQTGNAGKTLVTNGTTPAWVDPFLLISPGDGNWVNATTWINGTTYNANFPSPHFAPFWNGLNRFLLLTAAPPEFAYISGGFQVLTAGFDSATDTILLFFKGATS